jgi:hypothetical protein
VDGKTKAQVKDRLDNLHEELQAGVRTPATYTIEQCVKEWFESIERDEHTMETMTGQARNWIYPRIWRDQAQGPQCHRRGQVLPADRPVLEQAVAGHDQKHAPAVHHDHDQAAASILEPEIHAGGNVPHSQFLTLDAAE